MRQKAFVIDKKSEIIADGSIRINLDGHNKDLWIKPSHLKKMNSPIVDSLLRNRKVNTLSKFKEHMTDAMLEVYEGFSEKMEKECLYCLEQLIKANQAENVSLPYTNERGVSVTHGARLTINNISEYWYRRLTLASQFVSRDFEDKHQLWNRRVGLQK